MNLRKCKLSVKKELVYELCHECRCYFVTRGFSEAFATKVYEDYRRDHQYSGLLKPDRLSYRVKPTVCMDEDPLPTGDMRVRAAARELGKRLGGEMGQRIDDLHRSQREIMDWVRGAGRDSPEHERSAGPSTKPKDQEGFQEIDLHSERRPATSKRDGFSEIWPRSTLDSSNAQSKPAQTFEEMLAEHFGPALDLRGVQGRNSQDQPRSSRSRGDDERDSRPASDGTGWEDMSDLQDYWDRMR